MKSLKRSLLIAALFSLAPVAQATIVDLTVTGTWTAADYDVSSTGPDFPLSIPEENDDKVFGVSPSDGSISFTLQVNTDTAVSFTTGYNGITHDWFGYSDVTLLAPVSFGTATWDDSDILRSLVGVDGLKRALWTDANISLADPTRLSFRMMGDWDGRTADMFFGSRTSTTIGSTFLMWEYYKGEEIRSNTYSASSGRSVPEPGILPLVILGLVVIGYSQRKRIA